MTEQVIESSDKIRQDYEDGRSQSITFGGSVYGGGILAATALFIAFVLTAFAENDYVTKGIMILGGLLVGLSGIAFAFALHRWIVTKRHRAVAIALYYGELVILALNTIVSFSALLLKNQGIEMPPFIQWYEPISIVSIVYVIASWGTLFWLDPHAINRAKKYDILTRFDEKVVAKMEEFLDSDQGEDLIIDATAVQISERLMPQYTRRKTFGTGRKGPLTGQDFFARYGVRRNDNGQHEEPATVDPTNGQAK